MTTPPALQRHPSNPIVTPNGLPWRRATSFNPGVLYEDGVFYLYERAAGSLRPFQSRVGLLTSRDGVTFSLAQPEPVFSPEQMGYPQGAIEDPRVVKIDDVYYLAFAFRPYAYNCSPTGVGVPDYTPLKGELDVGINHTRSGLARSTDRVNWSFMGFTTEPEIDDRDNILFPEKIGGRFVLLRRPQGNQELYPSSGPGIWITWSDDLESWDQPVPLAEPAYPWEGKKIGGAAPPLRTEAGWLMLHHGVDPSSTYCVGAMLLDLDDPTRVIARTAEPIMRPETYYERFGAVIPNVVFPTGAVDREGTLYLYYGCCDTSIGLATVDLEQLVDYILS